MQVKERENEKKKRKKKKEPGAVDPVTGCHRAILRVHHCQHCHPVPNISVGELRVLRMWLTLCTNMLMVAVSSVDPAISGYSIE